MRGRRREKRPWTAVLTSVAAVLLVVLAGWYLRQRTPPPPPPTDTAGTVERGNIYDRRLRPLAVSLPVAAVLVRPRQARLDKGTVATLAVLLDRDPRELAAQLASARPLEWLARDLSLATADQVRQLGVVGLDVVTDIRRYYPEGELTGHLVGFFGQGHGLSGLELLADTHLAGDGAGRRHCVATVDLDLQRSLAGGLAATIQATTAAGATGVVLADNGEVLAMAAIPGFDPNRYWLAGEAALGNPVVDRPLPATAFAPLVSPPAGPDAITPAAGPMEGWYHQDQRVLASFPGGAAPFPDWYHDEVGRLGRRSDTVGGLEMAAVFLTLASAGRYLPPRLVAGYLDDNGAVVGEPPVGERTLDGAGAGFTPAMVWDGDYGFAEVRVTAPVAPPPAQDGEAEPAPWQGEVVLLGVVRGERPRVMVLSLHDAHLATATQASPLRSLAGRILAAAALVEPVVLETKALPALDHEELYRRWRASVAEPAGETRQEAPAADKRMPDVVGMSLRRALYTLREYGFHFRIQGSGRVVAQDPPAGAPIRSQRCWLQLQPEAP